MSNKDYVILEVAEILNKKGYNTPCRAYRRKNGELIIYDMEQSVDNMILVGDKCYEFLCPTLYEAQKWLREVHNIHVQIDFDSSQLWGYSLFKCKDQDDLINTDSMFDTFETALNFGILDALKRIDYEDIH